MTKKSEAQILADAYEFSRGLTKYYFSKLDGLDLNQNLEINGKKMNSPHWIAAHLVWTEHFLLIEGLGAPGEFNIPWLEQYGFGSDPEKITDKPEYDEILKKLEEVHEAAMKHLKSLTDEQLEEPNGINANFGGVNNKRNVIKHAIRHEPMHTGQISWILKANGVKMV
jgi:uncharacterized damage-inducible protein DinB